MKKFLKFFYNKYFLATAGFLIIMFLFDENDFILQYKRMEELSKTKADVEYLQNEISNMSKELDEIQNQPEMAKKLAREKYIHKQPDEDVFLIINDTIYKENKK